jgi:hypothetical protein
MSAAKTWSNAVDDQMSCPAIGAAANTPTPSMRWPDVFGISNHRPVRRTIAAGATIAAGSAMVAMFTEAAGSAIIYVDARP